jgi:hypothetical protein
MVAGARVGILCAAGRSSNLPAPLVYDETSVYDRANTLTSTDGSVVGRWEERTGTGPALVAASVATSPAFKWSTQTPSYGGVRFNGAHLLQCTSGAPSFFGGATWFVVMTMESNTLGIVLSRNLSTLFGWHYYCSSGTYVVQCSPSVNASGLAPFANTRFVFGMRYDPSKLTITTWCNNENRTDVVLGGLPDDSPYALVVGSGYSANGLTGNAGNWPMRGVVHALVFYPAVLADADVSGCFANLRTKYGC